MNRRTIAGLVTAAIAVTACSSGDGRTLDPPTEPLPAPPVVATTAPVVTAPPELSLVMPWPDGAPIPTRHTCDDADVSPAMTWANVPAGTIELAITLTDLDAPDYVHWIVYAIPPDRTSLTEAALPGGVLAMTNSAGITGFSGPCPPPGQQHRYQFTVHALNQQLEVADDAPATEVISILNQIAIDQSSVSGTYARAE
jgi:Raf kinase inhibitor-like YbhB/YbcL family protein